MIRKQFFHFICFILGAVVGGLSVLFRREKFETDIHTKSAEFYNILNKWLFIRQRGTKLSSYFISKKYNNISIFGLKELGERLYDEIHEDVNISYFIDRDADILYFEGMDIIKPDDQLSDVDAVVVTAVHYYDIVKNDLENKIECPIISLSDVIDEIILTLK